MRAILSSSSGAGIQISAGPLTVAWFVIFQLQIVVADIVIVLHPNSKPPPAVTDDAPQQVYRMYHIYDRNPFVCVLPSVITMVLFGELVSPRSPLPSLSLSRDFVGVSCGMAYRLQNPIPNQKALFDWSTTSFCLTIL